MPRRIRLVSVIKTVSADLTKENTYSNSSTSTNQVFDDHGLLKQVTLQDGQVVVNDIVNDIFDRKIGLANLSSSKCSVDAGFRDSEDMDKRLKLWQDTLRDREKMQFKIKRKTGKRPNEMLFNLPVTLEQRDKGTVQRLMDYADRMNPENLSKKTAAILTENINECQCICVPEVHETLPKPEKKGRTVVEIGGLTNATKKEILGSTAYAEPKTDHTKWLNSKVLDECIEKKAEDIKHVLEFYPDVNNLEVIGNNIMDVGEPVHNELINLVDRDSMYSISSSTQDTSLEDDEQEEEDKEETPSIAAEPEYINAGVKINNQIFIMDQRRSSQLVDVEIKFECQPYQRQLKQVLRLENIGRKIISCEWINQELFKRQLLLPHADCFLFDQTILQLHPGEVRITRVVFQPRTVGIRKQRWELKIFPNMFCYRRDSLVLQLIGKCKAPPEYLSKINKQVKSVIDKANKLVADELAKHQAELVPLLHATERLCPYERCFDDREVFNAQNTGYYCERFDDIESLRVLYNFVKMPRHPPWDLRLESLKKAIMRLPGAHQRESNFQMLAEIQQTMKCREESQFKRFEHNFERERSRFVYVKGCIGNGIEEWEDIMTSIEQSSFKSELTRFYARLREKAASDEEGSSEDEETKPWLRQLKYLEPELYVLKKLRGKKYYRDSLYMHTYTQLCDIAENIVSVIESTDYI